MSNSEKVEKTDIQACRRALHSIPQALGFDLDELENALDELEAVRQHAAESDRKLSDLHHSDAPEFVRQSVTEVDELQSIYTSDVRRPKDLLDD